MTILPRSFYLRPTIKVAQDLLGKKLVRVVRGQIYSGVIVEVEAYLGAKDAAAHTFNNHRSPRNETMYGIGGYAYVYFIYGMHFCFNVVTGKINQPEAVLIRALEPVEGISAMRKRRGVLRDLDLTNGPAKLCEALKITRPENGLDLTKRGSLFLENTSIRVPRSQIVAGPRIGVAYAGEAAFWPLRFHIKDNEFVSNKR